MSELLTKYLELKKLKEEIKQKEKEVKALMTETLQDKKEIELPNGYHLIRVTKVMKSYNLLTLKEVFDEDVFMQVVKPVSTAVKQMIKEVGLTDQEKMKLDDSEEIENVITYPMITNRNPKEETDENEQKKIDTFLKSMPVSKVYKITK